MKVLYSGRSFSIELHNGQPVYMFGDEYSFEIEDLANFLAELQLHVPVDYRASLALVRLPHQHSESS